MPAWVWRVSVLAAGWLAPARGRAEWRRKWASNVRDWRVLVERGELPASGGIELVKRAISDAFRERFGVVRMYRLLRGPYFLIAVCLASLLLIALFSRGFAVSRALIALAHDLSLHPNPGVRYDIRGDRLFEYTAPIVIAASVGLALLFLQRRALRSLGWRSWALLAFKMVVLHTVCSLLWVEGGHAIRSQMAREGFRFGVAGLLLAIVFVLGFGFATLWSIADERRRCPVCLHRLVMPVTMGSWASVFDPAATELVCEEGHGSLALMETEAEPAPLDRWTELDSSWQYLFRKTTETKPNSGKLL